MHPILLIPALFACAQDPATQPEQTAREALTRASAASETAREVNEELPDIVLILADDLGLGDLGCYNPDSKIPTPHMDRLAEEGTRFTDAHSPSAVCSPTRYGVLTGRYAWRTRLKSGVLWGSSRNLIALERLTLPELLQRRGYRTGAVGKWHLGLGQEEPTDYSERLVPSPLDHGFEFYFGIPASLDMAPYLYVLGDRAVQAPSVTVAGSKHRRQEGGGFWRKGAAAPDFRHDEVLPRCAERAVEFIQRAGREEPQRPFFLYLPLSAPHTPWLPTEEFRGRSGAGHYGDFVCQVDDVVGAVVAALERMGRLQRTLIVFTSDNGCHWPDGDIKRWGHDGNLGLRGQKADIWEGGHRVPLVARWPGRVPQGAQRGDLLCLTDLMATFATLTGAPLPDDAGEDSFDQSAALLGDAQAAPARDHVVHHSAQGMFAVRSGPWKLIDGLGSGGFTAPRKIEPEPDGAQGQLYHLGRDPAEAENVWLANPEVVAALRERLDECRSGARSRPLAE